jgi:hypothetical protein
MWRPQQLNRVDDWLSVGGWRAWRIVFLLAIGFQSVVALGDVLRGDWWSVILEASTIGLFWMGQLVIRDVIERKTLLNGRKMYVTDRKEPDGR